MNPTGRQSTISPTKFYDDHAQEFNSQRFSCNCGQMLAKIEERNIASEAPRSGYILDIGTGTGRLTVALGRGGMRVISTDSSRNMILLARRRVEKLGLESRVDFIMADGRRLPFKDSSISGIVCIRTLSHYPVITDFLGEFSRITRDWGVLLIDAPSRLTPLYQRLIRARNIQSFEDFYHFIPNLRHQLDAVGIRITRVISYSVMPPSLVHRAICNAGGARAHRAMHALLRFRPGVLKLVRGEKCP